MEQVVLGRLVIYVGPTPEGPFKPVRPEEVPTWLQQPKVLGAMVEGNLAHNPDHGEDAPWYAAVKCEEQKTGSPVLKVVERRVLLPGEAGHG